MLFLHLLLLLEFSKSKSEGEGEGGGQTTVDSFQVDVVLLLLLLLFLSKENYVEINVIFKSRNGKKKKVVWAFRILLTEQHRTGQYRRRTQFGHFSTTCLQETQEEEDEDPSGSFLAASSSSALGLGATRNLPGHL